MAHPKHATNSMHAYAPGSLISASPSSAVDQERRRVSVLVDVHPSQDDELTTFPKDEGEGRSGYGVGPNRDGRLAAAGRPVPTEAEVKEDSALLGIQADSNPEVKYGTYDDRHPLLPRASPLVEGSPYSTNLDPDDLSEVQYKEAALLVCQGEDNAKFYHHPTGKWSKKAYKFLHHKFYHVFNLIVCVLLMLLVLGENPGLADDADLTVEAKIAITVVHAILEIFLLLILWFDIFLRFLWFRQNNFFFHKRTMFIAIVLLVMSVEAITVIARQQNHFRITRALRPVFLVDTNLELMDGVRRILRQIFYCIKSILDVLILLMFGLVFFSLLGYYTFAEIDHTYFDSFSKTLVSLFITTTTANNPDVMMEAYSQQPASSIFFMMYIVVMIYFISNVLLAIVHSNFMEADKNKFKKLFLHKRDALRKAYNVLMDHSVQRIKSRDFLRFMQQYRPIARKSDWQVISMCIFKALHKDPLQQHADLSLNDFYDFYEVRDYKWEQEKQVTAEGPCFVHFHQVITIKRIRTLVKTKWFKLIINLIIVINLLFLLIYTLFITKEEVHDRFERLRIVLPVSFTFVCFYIIEIILKLIGFGPVSYFRKPWNVIDILLIVTSFVLLIVEATTPYSYLAVFRPVKLLRLLRLKRRYRDIMNTFTVLSRRLISVGILLFIVYYFFAIIGMEFFDNGVSPGCCNNSWYDVGEYYSGNNSNTSLPATPNVYYLNNFENILRSYVTLFILMVVNNWYVIMEGFASSSQNDWLIRIYFMLFFIITLVVLQIVKSFTLEAFLVKIKALEKKRACPDHPNRHCTCYKAREQEEEKKRACPDHPNRHCTCYKEEKRTCPDHPNSHWCYCDKSRELIIKTTISLDSADITELNSEMTHKNRTRLNRKNSSGKYSGRRIETKDNIHLLMYQSELKHWIQERDRELEKTEEIKPKVPIWKIFGEYVLGFVEYVLE